MIEAQIQRFPSVWNSLCELCSSTCRRVDVCSVPKAPPRALRASQPGEKSFVTRLRIVSSMKFLLNGTLLGGAAPKVLSVVK